MEFLISVRHEVTAGLIIRKGSREMGGNHPRGIISCLRKKVGWWNMGPRKEKGDKIRRGGLLRKGLLST